MALVYREVNLFLASKVETANDSTEQSVSPIKLYYKIQMNVNYKQDETKIRKIISDNVHLTTESPLKLLIYIRNQKLSGLLIDSRQAYTGVSDSSQKFKILNVTKHVFSAFCYRR